MSGAKRSEELPVGENDTQTHANAREALSHGQPTVPTTVYDDAIDDEDTVDIRRWEAGLLYRIAVNGILWVYGGSNKDSDNLRSAIRDFAESVRNP